ncbi:IclR family transcriptional regulator [Micromonospora sp. CPCC 206060]|uniref:IclR family transcriptional regulator n=1 Tax=Micromonospora sp. CPCC 206060 TaxID=3122406 RepID=UPI002FF18728
MANADPPIDSVHRAFVLLKALRDGEVLSVTDAAARLGVVPSTAYRLLCALCFDGFAEQDRDRRYRAGPQLRTAEPVHGSVEELRQHVHPVVEELCSLVGETVHVWVRQGALLRLVDGVPGTRPRHVSSDQWDRVPAHTSAAGKALLSELNNRQLDLVFSGGLLPSRSTRIITLQALKRHLATVRRRGYALNLEETAQGVDGVGAVARDGQGRPVLAMSLAIPSIRFERAMVPEYVDLLTDAIRATEGLLATRGGRAR